jgi:putative SOS response-associated peptidase YedK
MCGRFASQLPAELVARIFRTSNPLPNLAPNWNTAPSQSALVVRRHLETGERHLDALKWGLLPYWTKAPAKARKPINARSETAATSGMFRAALKNRRAIVPCDAFYEWRTMPDGAKEPFAIGRQDRAPVALAGIWEGFKDQQGEVTRSFAIMTTTANATMAFLHDRMPVILEPDAWGTWLDGPDNDAMALMRPAAETVLRLWPVSTQVNSVRNNGPHLLDEAPDKTASNGGPNPE